VYSGIYNPGTLNTGGGDDTITGFGSELGFINEAGTLDTGEGNDIISGSGQDYGILLTAFDFNNFGAGTLNTGEGNDIITGIGSIYGISNNCTINTGNGQDSIISEGSFINRGEVFLGEGNDTITSTRALYNEGIIETGNGDDSIIVDGSVDDLTGTPYGIYNNGGAINMGDGNDSIIANEGFQSGPNSSGAWFLGEGDDYIKGYGSGDFYGGNGNDTLELTPGTYTVGIWGEGGESPIFTKGDQLMITSEFEKLRAGNTIYDFTSLTAGQIIVVA
jgi:Ca2+-binding RTX toxin-like protein